LAHPARCTAAPAGLDDGGPPLAAVLQQLEILGGEVVPVLRRDLDARRPARVPDGPTHARVEAVATAASADGDNSSPVTAAAARG
jgi:hypothetical protein